MIVPVTREDQRYIRKTGCHGWRDDRAHNPCQPEELHRPSIQVDRTTGYGHDHPCTLGTHYLSKGKEEKELGREDPLTVNYSL